MADTFSPGLTLLTDPVGTTTYRTLKAQFGDGYAQMAADGLNNRMDSWPLQFACTPSEMQAIKAFMDAQGGYKAFNWTPPGGTQGLYRNGPVALTPTNHATWYLSCTLELAYKP